MQKLDLLIKMKAIRNRLQSDAIVKLFDAGFSNPTVNYDYGQINPFLFSSKSQFDQMILDPEYIKVVSELPDCDVFSEQNLAFLTRLLHANVVSNILSYNIVAKLYNFHKSIIATNNLLENILKNNLISDSFDDDLDKGLIVFQISIVTEGIPTSQYVKIFSLIDELTVVIGKIKNIPENESEIILLDSGSDSALGLKTGIEVARSLFLIFKEIWDFITKYRYVKSQNANTALMESLTIRKEILLKAEENVITDTEAMEYIHYIKTRTDALIGLKVLPKQLTLTRDYYDSNKMLDEYESMKMLENNN